MSTDREETKDVRYVYTHTHRHIHTVEYYLVIKKNEIMSSAATRMDPETVILSEVGKDNII